MDHPNGWNKSLNSSTSTSRLAAVVDLEKTNKFATLDAKPHVGRRNGMNSVLPADVSDGLHDLLEGLL